MGGWFRELNAFISMIAGRVESRGAFCCRFLADGTVGLTLPCGPALIRTVLEPALAMAGRLFRSEHPAYRPVQWWCEPGRPLRGRNAIHT